MSHVERPQIFAWLARAGYRPVTLPRLRAMLARRAERAAADEAAVEQPAERRA
jgi:hypothetical protein